MLVARFVALSVAAGLAACAGEQTSPQTAGAPLTAAVEPASPRISTVSPAPVGPPSAGGSATVPGNLTGPAGVVEDVAPTDKVGNGPAPPRLNDPSAPADTPLCGRAARERVAMDAAAEPDVVAGAGACAQTACFDPATDTFIGADGYRHVCQ